MQIMPAATPGIFRRDKGDPIARLQTYAADFLSYAWLSACARGVRRSQGDENEMSSKSSRPLRKQLFVDRRVQGALLLRTGSYWLYCLLTLTLLTLCWRIANSEPQTFQSHMAALKNDFAPAAIGSLLLLPIVLFDVLRLSNRFTGPMVRVRRMMGELAEGQTVPPLKFRDGDFWNEFAEDFNAVASRLEELQAKVAKLEQEAAEPELAAG
jgi:hypothetical protein